MVGEAEQWHWPFVKDYFHFNCFCWLLCLPSIPQISSSVLSGLLTGVGSFPRWGVCCCCCCFLFSLFQLTFRATGIDWFLYPLISFFFGSYFFCSTQFCEVFLPLSESCVLLSAFSQFFLENSSTNRLIFNEFMGIGEPHVLLLCHYLPPAHNWRGSSPRLLVFSPDRKEALRESISCSYYKQSPQP